MAGDPNTLIVQFFYQYILGQSAPDPAGVAYWVGQYNAGMSAQALVQSFVNAKGELPAPQAETFVAGATDVASNEITRDATAINGGTAGFVNGTERNIDNVGVGDKSFEWAETNILNSAALAGTENVAGYNQANGTGTGEVWGGVDQVTQSQDAPAVGLEIDVKKPVGTADGLGLDIVNEGGETAATQVGDGDIIDRDRNFTNSFLKWVNGGLQIVIRGINVTPANWV